MRRGRRIASAHALVYWRANDEHSTVRFGFVITKSVGNAVRRNLVRRRLKSIAVSLLTSIPPGTDVVVRALPVSAQASWDTLSTELRKVVSKGMARA